MVRFAFTMIELVFAIVIIGITVISLPMMTQATSKGIENSLVQEAIFAASAELNLAVTYHWDENSTEVNSTDTLARVIDTGDCNSFTRLRPGHVGQPLHRRCLDSNLTRPSAIGSDLDDLDDLDDIDSVTQHIFVVSGTGSISSAHGYKNDYNSTTNVSYAAFNDTNASSHNMKKITVTIKDQLGKIITVLSTYSANIGEVDYYKRSY